MHSKGVLMGQSRTGLLGQDSWKKERVASAFCVTSNCASRGSFRLLTAGVSGYIHTDSRLEIPWVFPDCFAGLY